MLLFIHQQEVNDWKDVSNAFITSIMRKGKVIYGL